MSNYKQLEDSLSASVTELERQLKLVKQRLNDLRSMGDVTSLDENVLSSSPTSVEVIRHVVNDNRKAVTLVFILNHAEEEIYVGFADSGSAATWDRKEGVYLARSRLNTKYQIIIRLTSPMRELTAQNSLVSILATVLNTTPDYEGLSKALRKMKARVDRQDH
jgi:hypothetical protein